MRTGDPLVAFLYMLMRDKVPVGDVTEIIVELERAKERGENEFVFSDDALGQVAWEKAERLRHLGW